MSGVHAPWTSSYGSIGVVGRPAQRIPSGGGGSVHIGSGGRDRRTPTSSFERSSSGAIGIREGEPYPPTSIESAGTPFHLEIVKHRTTIPTVTLTIPGTKRVTRLGLSVLRIVWLHCSPLEPGERPHISFYECQGRLQFPNEHSEMVSSAVIASMCRATLANSSAPLAFRDRLITLRGRKERRYPVPAMGSASSK